VSSPVVGELVQPARPRERQNQLEVGQLLDPYRHDLHIGAAITLAVIAQIQQVYVTVQDHGRIHPDRRPDAPNARQERAHQAGQQHRVVALPAVEGLVQQRTNLLGFLLTVYRAEEAHRRPTEAIEPQ